ncbi:MAG: ATP-binding protein [Phycisphaerae bacterium]|nr:ATP-binding protein [Phycisphaerae bacterium]
MTSLRTRLLAGTVGGMLLLLAVLSLIVYVTIRRALFEQLDAGLEAAAHLFAASIEQDANDVELGIEPEFQDARHETYYQLWGADETVMAKSPLLDSNDLWRIADGVDSPAFANSRAEDGRLLRAIGLRFTPRAADNDGEPPRKTNLKALSLTVARDATELRGQLRFLRWLLLTASAAVTALSLLIAAVVVRHGLLPLNAIAAQIGAIRANDLTARVDATRIPAEIAPIQDRLNDLLSRIEASFQRERRFTADVAHELRTPLAGLRSTIEVTLVRARERQEYQTVLSDCLEIVQNMQAMVSNLLMLARLDTRQIVLRRDRILLADLVDACWRPFCERAEQRQITFESTIPGDLTCLCDPDNLSMVVSNLLANASEYTNDGGGIWAAAHPADGHVELTISNTGCSLSKEQISQVFDCFWRGDSSRKDAGVHCGLGLALVQRLVTALGGSVVAELQAGGLFVVRINIGGCSTDLH